MDIDGSERSGSGTILRIAIACSAITGQPIHIYKIRENRPQRGLKPQHLEAVLTAAKLCDAEIKGADLDSQEVWFWPKEIRGGRIESEIGTAGSIPMLLMAVMPICAFAKNKVCLHVSNGGTDVPQSPTANYMRYVLSPLLRRMGLDIDFTVKKYGYYPRGAGEITMNIEPCKSLQPLTLTSAGNVTSIEGVSVCTGLAERAVARRQAEAATKLLKQQGYEPEIQIINDNSNPLQKGSSLTLWARTDTGAILGADAIGEIRKSSEKVGEEAAEKLIEEIKVKPTVDIHLADMLIPYVSMATGKSTFLTRQLTQHLQTNIWLTEKLLGAKFLTRKSGPLYDIETVFPKH
jgi:RNA 3'-terminal phosphate cyclase (ATP)